MNTFEGIDGLKLIAPGGVMSIGNFDGIHRGHAFVLETMKSLCDAASGANAARGDSASARIAVVTFEPHPLTVLRPALAPPRLTPPMLKRELLERAGVDDYVVLPPTHDVLDLSAERFWEILRDDVQPAHLVEGESFNFGKDRRGTIARLREWCAGCPMKLHVLPGVSIPLLNYHVAPVSSSLIRWLLSHGRVRDAAICLGRPYLLQGEVVTGNQRGRTIGVPTANIATGSNPTDSQLIPADGVYAARCTIDGATYATAVSIGTTPTFNGATRQIEAHLIDYTGDLYGRTIAVELIDWLRDQMKFPNIDLLKSRITRDLHLTKSLPA